MPPDAQARHLDRYCDELLPAMLTGACGVGLDDAIRVADDIRHRAAAAARLDRHVLEILATPFFEESVDHEPAGAPAWMKAITTLVIRNSRIEEEHACGPVESGGIEAITTHGLDPLSRHLTAPRQGPVPTGAAGEQFDHLPELYPRAWAALAALRDALNEGAGRVGYRSPDAPVLDLPSPDEIVEAPAPTNVEAPSAGVTVVFSAIDPRFDDGLVSLLRHAADSGGVLLGLSALSRLSRHSGKLLRCIEFLLGHDARILTTNHLLTTREVWVRRRRLIKPDSERPLSGIRRFEGLSGAHRKAVLAYLAEVEPRPA